MISISAVWNRVNELGKTGTSGYDSQDEFNDKIYSVQLELAEVLADVYEENQKASDALAPFIIKTDITTLSNGLITKPSDYLHLCTIWLLRNGNIYPTAKLPVNGTATTLTSPVRGPSLVNNDVAYNFVNDKIQLYPNAIMTVRVIYIKQPDLAKITLIPASNADSDYLTVDANPANTIDLKWPVSMFNIIVYMVLEKLGIEMKEQLLVEFAMLGIQRERINTKQ